MFDLKLHVGADADATGPAAVEAAVLGLRDYFHRRNPDQRCLLLVDPQARDLPARPNGRHSLAAMPRTTFSITNEAFPPLHQPYLLTLDPTLPQFGAWLADSLRIALEDRRPDTIASAPSPPTNFTGKTRHQRTGLNSSSAPSISGMPDPPASGANCLTRK